MSWISPTFGDDPGPSSRPASKRRKTAPTITSGTPPLTSSTSSCDWPEKYKPKSVEELAVNVKKVKELESWLKQSVNFSSYAKMLLITGPSGCGKTTTLHLLCKNFGFKVLEWITPLDKIDDPKSPSQFEVLKSAAKQFEEFLFRSSRYSSCLMSTQTKKLILVKDFPNVFLYNPPTFHEVLENFCAKCMNPVVFICSDESLCRKLFSATLKENCQMQTITFNGIPEQRMLKVLKSFLLKEAQDNKNIKMLSDKALSDICQESQGDLRSAISKMAFCAIYSTLSIAQLQPSQEKIKKSNSPDESATTNKDARLDFFHGIGRVLYPKRTDGEGGLRFVHSTDTIVDNFLSEPNNFINQLHENYPLKMGSIYDLADAAERLSKSNMLMTRWQDKEIFQTYSLSVAVKGLMVCNRNPQKAKFEGFRRSQTSRMEVDSKAVELEAKSTFSEFCSLDYKHLLDILPYSRLLLPGLNPGQLEYIRKTCQFK